QARRARPAVEHRELAEKHPRARAHEHFFLVARERPHHGELALLDHEEAIAERALPHDLLARIEGARAAEREEPRAVFCRQLVEKVAAAEKHPFPAAPRFRQCPAGSFHWGRSTMQFGLSPACLSVSMLAITFCVFMSTTVTEPSLSPGRLRSA